MPDLLCHLQATWSLSYLASMIICLQNKIIKNYIAAGKVAWDKCRNADKKGRKVFIF